MALAPINPLMIPPWAGCIRWALGDANILSQFRAETGNTYTPLRTPIDQMVDEARGVEGLFLEAFVRWFNSNLWGEVDGRACNGDEPEAGDA